MWLHFFLLSYAIFEHLSSQADAGQLNNSCSYLELRNGRIRVRSRGRIAKFSCYKPYVLVGDNVATCVNGEWNTQMPFCAKPGCRKLEKLLHGELVASYRGAVVKPICDSGFTLIGAQVLYCTDNSWNDVVPKCQAQSIDQFKSCHFEPDEDEQCDWINKPSIFGWRVLSSTITSKISDGSRTHPSFDHTLAPHVGGHYLYLEANYPASLWSLRQVQLHGGAAQYISPLFPPLINTDIHSCLIFWYYMFGPHTGTIRVNVGNDTVWEKIGSMGNMWQKALIILQHQPTDFHVAIEGVGLLGYYSNTAIDDLKIVTGTECSNSFEEVLEYTVEPDMENNGENKSDEFQIDDNKKNDGFTNPVEQSTKDIQFSPKIYQNVTDQYLTTTDKQFASSNLEASTDLDYGSFHSQYNVTDFLNSSTDYSLLTTEDVSFTTDNITTVADSSLTNIILLSSTEHDNEFVSSVVSLSTTDVMNDTRILNSNNFMSENTLSYDYNTYSDTESSEISSANTRLLTSSKIYDVINTNNVNAPYSLNESEISSASYQDNINTTESSQEFYPSTKGNIHSSSDNYSTFIFFNEGTIVPRETIVHDDVENGIEKNKYEIEINGIKNNDLVGNSSEFENNEVDRDRLPSSNNNKPTAVRKNKNGVTKSILQRLRNNNPPFINSRASSSRLGYHNKINYYQNIYFDSKAVDVSNGTANRTSYYRNNLNSSQTNLELERVMQTIATKMKDDQSFGKDNTSLELNKNFNILNVDMGSFNKVINPRGSSSVSTKLYESLNRLTGNIFVAAVVIVLLVGAIVTVIQSLKSKYKSSIHYEDPLKEHLTKPLSDLELEFVEC